MRHTEFQTLLQERASPILYHYTNIYAGLQILSSGHFELSSVVGNQSETDLAPQGYPYFLSTARTRIGDYMRYIGSSAVLFVLDGDWFNRRYKVKPVDYWERAWLQGLNRTRESEDRVFSREPTISIGGVREVHVLITETESHRSPRARQLLLAARRRGIPAYLYDDREAFRLLDKRRSISVSQAGSKLSGSIPARRTYRSDLESSLDQWLELIHKKSRGELTPRADKLAHNLVYYGRGDTKGDQNLGNDLSNARKPDSGADRRAAVKLIQIMRQQKIMSTVDLKNRLAEKWAEIFKQDNRRPAAQGLAERVNDSVFDDFESTKSLNQDYYLKAWGRTEDGKPLLSIAVFNRQQPEKSVGHVTFEVRRRKLDDEPYLEADMVWVSQVHRGKGLAKAMYRWANELGNDITPSKTQLTPGKIMWQHMGSEIQQPSKPTLGGIGRNIMRHAKKLVAEKENGKTDPRIAKALVQARAAYPLAKSAEEALALYVMDQQRSAEFDLRNKDRDLERDNRREDEQINRLEDLERSLEDYVAQLDARLRRIEDDREGR